MRDEQLHDVAVRSTLPNQIAQNTQLRSTFRSWDIEKVHAVVVRSTFRSQNLEKTPHVRSTFGSWDVEKVHARRCGAKTGHAQANFGSWDVDKADAVVARQVRTFEEDPQRCMSRGRRSTRDMSIRDVRRSGPWFPEKGCIFWSIRSSVLFKTQQVCETSSFFELDNIKTEAILRDFLNFWSWQHQKRSNSARLLQKWKVDCRADGLVPMRFAIFLFHLSKVLRLPRKSVPGHTKCCTCHAKSSEEVSPNSFAFNYNNYYYHYTTTTTANTNTDILR